MKYIKSIITREAELLFNEDHEIAFQSHRNAQATGLHREH